MEPRLESSKCPRGFGARRPRLDLRLLGRSSRANVFRWVNAESSLEPGKGPRGFGARPTRSFPCWVEVLEQVSLAGSTWNLLTWKPLSVPLALAPEGSGRRSSQREGYNEKMRNVTFMVGKWEHVFVLHVKN